MWRGRPATPITSAPTSTWSGRAGSTREGATRRSPSAVSRVTIRAPHNGTQVPLFETPTPHAFLPDALPADDRSTGAHSGAQQASVRALAAGGRTVAGRKPFR